jgi:uracil-DNA glycosylase family 4
MTHDEDLKKQILEHLKFYQDLGVRWVRPTERRDEKRSVRVEEPVHAPTERKTASSFVIQRRIEDTISVTESAPVNDSLEAIQADMKDCRRCKLAPGRKNIVFGSGNPKAELMFVGEAPGADEDEQGLPFVGRAGQLLTKIIEAMEMSRNDVFICNILKCRPPGNRNPEPDEIAACEPFLFRQIAVVRPKIICALGAYGAQTLLKTTEAIGRLRGRLLDYRGLKLVATYHPAYLLRNPMEKRKVWEDMLLIRRYLDSVRSSQ